MFLPFPPFLPCCPAIQPSALEILFGTGATSKWISSTSATAINSQSIWIVYAVPSWSCLCFANFSFLALLLALAGTSCFSWQGLLFRNFGKSKLFQGIFSFLCILCSCSPCFKLLKSSASKSSKVFWSGFFFGSCTSASAFSSVVFSSASSGAGKQGKALVLLLAGFCCEGGASKAFVMFGQHLFQQVHSRLRNIQVSVTIIVCIVSMQVAIIFSGLQLGLSSSLGAFG